MRKKMVKKFVQSMKAMVLVGAVVAGSLTGGLAGKKAEAASSSVSGVSAISNLSSDFIRGVDISSLASFEDAGTSFYYLDGTKGDMFDILSGAGVNYVRLKIWNNPYDSSSPYKGYGGGNSDLSKAKTLGKRATDAGMKVFIDFHYSDFWCDPEKQFAPKEWSSYTLAQKKQAVYGYTKWALGELLDYGVDVGIVQIGNETNGSMCGVGGLYDGVWDLSSGVADLMQEGCYAVDDINASYGKSILKALHFTDLNENGQWYASCLNAQGVDYDIYSTSYYPMWHGTAADLTTNLTTIAKTYNKKVMVAETAYPYTLDNLDDTSNTVSEYCMNYTNYSVSVAGQAEAVKSICEAVNNVNTNYKSGYGLGAFYWEPSWIPTSSSARGTYGTGWASSTSGNFELLYNSSVNFFSTTDKGSSWENMALFDTNGVAMKSLYVFNDMAGKTSTTSSGSTLDGTYYIRSKFSGKYLNIAGGSSANNANLEQYSYSGGVSQKFKLVSDGNGYYSIYTGASGYSKVLDVAKKSAADGTNVAQYTANGGNNQKFEVVQVASGIYAIKTKISSGKSGLDVYGWSTANGGNIAQYSYWGGDCQLWYLVKAE
ncbi:MAG: glycosyl hydrolase 53 family protein [Lachnospiraceae bacterium]|nr:glycosyl hydrolase 53 family protein [Lachnospiraceae bacterium]